MKILIGIYLFFAMGLATVAAIMAYNNKPHWGWFLFAAIVVVGSISITENNKKTKE